MQHTGRSTIALRLYPTPSAPVVLDVVVLVGAIAGLIFPVAPLLLLLVGTAALLRRFAVIDPGARQIRIAWGHPLSPLVTARFPFEAPIRVRARAVREVTRNTSGSVIATAEHDVHEVCVGDQAVTRTRSAAYASELAAQLAYAVDGGATLPLPPWSHTRGLEAARVAIALLTILTLLARPLVATTQLASSLAMPLGSLAGESFQLALQGTAVLCVALLGTGLGPKLARLTGHPCEEAAVRRQSIVAAVAGVALGLGAAVVFGGSSALASWVDGQSRAERFASLDRGAPTTAPAVSPPLAPPPAPPPGFPVPPSGVAPPARLGAALDMSDAVQRLTSAGYPVRGTPSTSSVAYAWSAQAQVGDAHVSVEWYDDSRSGVAMRFGDRRVAFASTGDQARDARVAERLLAAEPPFRTSIPAALRRAGMQLGSYVPLSPRSEFGRVTSWVFSQDGRYASLLVEDASRDAEHSIFVQGDGCALVVMTRGEVPPGSAAHVASLLAAP